MSIIYKKLQRNIPISAIKYTDSSVSDVAVRSAYYNDTLVFNNYGTVDFATADDATLASLIRDAHRGLDLSTVLIPNIRVLENGLYMVPVNFLTQYGAVMQLSIYSYGPIWSSVGWAPIITSDTTQNDTHVQKGTYSKTSCDADTFCQDLYEDQLPSFWKNLSIPFEIELCNYDYTLTSDTHDWSDAGITYHISSFKYVVTKSNVSTETRYTFVPIYDPSNLSLTPYIGWQYRPFIPGTHTREHRWWNDAQGNRRDSETESQYYSKWDTWYTADNAYKFTKDTNILSFMIMV